MALIGYNPDGTRNPDDPRRDAIVEARIQANVRATVSLQTAIISLLRSSHQEENYSKLAFAMDEVQTAYYEKHGINIEPAYPFIRLNENFFGADAAPIGMTLVITGNFERDSGELTQQLRNNLEGNLTPELAAKQDRLSAIVLAKNAPPTTDEVADELATRDSGYIAVGMILKAVKNILTSNTTINTSFSAPNAEGYKAMGADKCEAYWNDQLFLEAPDNPLIGRGQPNENYPDLRNEEYFPQSTLLHRDFGIVGVNVNEVEFSSLRVQADLPLPYDAFGFLDFILTTEQTTSLPTPIPPSP